MLGRNAKECLTDGDLIVNVLDIVFADRYGKDLYICEKPLPDTGSVLGRALLTDLIREVRVCNIEPTLHYMAPGVSGWCQQRMGKALDSLMSCGALETNSDGAALVVENAAMDQGDLETLSFLEFAGVARHTEGKGTTSWQITVEGEASVETCRKVLNSDWALGRT